MHILTYTNVYIHIRIYTWKYVCWMIRCELWCAASALQWLGLGAARPLTLPDSDSGCQWAARWPLTGHQSPAASGPGRLDAAESLTVTVTHTFNQPKSDGRPAAGPPAPGGGLPLSRAGRSSARLMSGRTEHIKQIQDYVSVRSAAQDLFLND